MKSKDMNYFKVGGELPPNWPSYVVRKADHLILDALLGGEYCHVLAPRQMGKSSLKTRVSMELSAMGYTCVTIVITSIGIKDISEDQFYFSVLHDILRPFPDLKDYLDVFWEAKQYQTTISRFIEFMEFELLPKVDKGLYVFIDEIDSLLSADLSRFSTDNFFSLLRNLYNARALNPLFAKFTVTLFGVAMPMDFSRDRNITPFNIGVSVQLSYFTLEECDVMLKGLGVEEEAGREILREIHEWTSGQPVLTNKLCKAVALSHRENGRKGDSHPHEFVDSVVRELFLSEHSLPDSNLRNTEDRILMNKAYGLEMVGLYKKVLEEGPQKADSFDPMVGYLALSGIVRHTGSLLVVASKLHAERFDSKWVSAARSRLNRPYENQVRQWKETGGKHLLLKGESLEKMIKWASPRRDLTEDERTFIDESIKLDQKIKYAHYRRRTLQVSVMVGIPALLLFSLVLAYAFNLEGTAIRGIANATGTLDSIVNAQPSRVSYSRYVALKDSLEQARSEVGILTLRNKMNEANLQSMRMKKDSLSSNQPSPQRDPGPKYAPTHGSYFELEAKRSDWERRYHSVQDSFRKQQAEHDKLKREMEHVEMVYKPVKVPIRIAYGKVDARQKPGLKLSYLEVKCDITSDLTNRQDNTHLKQNIALVRFDEGGSRPEFGYVYLQRGKKYDVVFTLHSAEKKVKGSLFKAEMSDKIVNQIIDDNREFVVSVSTRYDSNGDPVGINMSCAYTGAQTKKKK